MEARIAARERISGSAALRWSTLPFIAWSGGVGVESLIVGDSGSEVMGGIASLVVVDETPGVVAFIGFGEAAEPEFFVVVGSATAGAFLGAVQSEDEIVGEEWTVEREGDHFLGTSSIG